MITACLLGKAYGIDHWAWVLDNDPGKYATLVYGYGTDFPKGDPIKDSFFDSNFLTPRVIGPSGPVELVPDGLQIWVYYTKAPLTAPGRYFVLTDNKPTFWTKTKSDNIRKPKNEVRNAVSCTEFVYNGKYILTQGTAPDADYEKPQNFKLEIVPLSDPATLKEDEPFKVKILFEGKPLPKAELNAFPQGFSKDNASYAFSGRADEEGILEIIPLKAGIWLAKVIKQENHADPAVCDKVQYYSSFTFVVNEGSKLAETAEEGPSVTPAAASGSAPGSEPGSASGPAPGSGDVQRSLPPKK